MLIELQNAGLKDCTSMNGVEYMYIVYKLDILTS